MHNINIRPVRDLRNNYAEIEAMLGRRDPVIITKNGKGSAVLISIEDFADYKDFMHASYINEKLREAEEEAESPDAVWLTSEEVDRQMKEKYDFL